MSKTVLLIAFFVLGMSVPAAPGALQNALAQTIVSHEEGFVVDGVTLAPITGALVTFYKTDPTTGASQPAGTGTTDAAGKYYVLLSADNYRRVVSAQGYQESAYPGQYGQTSAHQHDIELVSAAAGSELRGKLYDATSGSPLENVSVDIHGTRHRDFKTNFSATSEYVVRLPGPDDYVVRFSKPSFVDFGLEYTVAEAGSSGVQSIPLMPRSEPWGWVSVSVYTVSGDRPVGVDVTFSSKDRSWSFVAPTGSSGTVSAVAFEGAIAAEVADPRYGDGSASGNVVAGSNNGLKIVLGGSGSGEKARVEGRVIDEAGNVVGGAAVRLNNEYVYYAATEGKAAEPVASSPDSPASTSVMRAYPCCDYEYQETTTDSDGTFGFSTYAGNKRISVEARGFGYANRLVTVSGGETARADFTLEKVPGYTVKVTGAVIDANTGKPVSGASVNVENVEWSRYNYTTTDPQGRFMVMTMPGYTNVVVRVDQYCCVVYASEGTAEGSGGSSSGSGGTASDPVASNSTESSTAGPAVASPLVPSRDSKGPEYYTYVTSFESNDGDTVTLDIKLKPKPEPDSKIIGYVVDSKTNQAIPGAYVYVQNEDTGDWGYASTDENGSFIFTVRAGHHLVGASAEGHFQRMVAVDVGSKDVQRVDLILVAGEQKYAPYEEHYYKCPPDADCAAPMMEASDSQAPSSYSTGGSQASSVGRSTAFAGNDGQASYSGKGGLPKYGEKIDLDELREKCTAGILECRSVPGPEIALVAVGVLGAVAVLRSRRK
ncbi:MAG: carboxypeptidase regulatory-like domain-containing protein [Euryarchaeota archaeon]|nr:carboxypeptidase regulatory-like domain-containing protein [Euryarchaeota archaeon]